MISAFLSDEENRMGTASVPPEQSYTLICLFPRRIHRMLPAASAEEARKPKSRSMRLGRLLHLPDSISIALHANLPVQPVKSTERAA